MGALRQDLTDLTELVERLLTLAETLGGGKV